MDLRLDRGGGTSLATQLEARLRAAIADGSLGPGDRLPSLRHVAADAGVNVNTVRAVYARMEAAGAIVTEQGRGTFVASADVPSVAARGELSPADAHGGERSSDVPGGDPSPATSGGVRSPADARHVLREQIAHLEGELARMPAPRPMAEVAQPPAHPGLLTTAELAAVRDALLDRLGELDAARADVVRRLATLDESTAPPGRSTAAPDDAAAAAPRRSSSTLSGARVRWVGA